MRAFKIFIAAALVEILFRILRWTWRIEEGAIPPEAQERLARKETLVWAHWHQDEWALFGAFSGRDMAVLVSDSADGSIMARFAERMGFRVLRGSSSKNAVRGFLQLLRSVKKEKIANVSLAVDGPRGPRYEPKAGILKLAEVLGGPLILGAAYADRAWVFRKSWSQAFVPKPFARVCIEYTCLNTNDLNKLESQNSELSSESLANIKNALMRAKDLARRRSKAPRQ
jgi:lysophospholipid acyltransferase (LPLAT)-like uncharacterized protein